MSMIDNKQEPKIEELKYICERQNMKIEKLLSIIAKHNDTISELEVDCELLQAQTQNLNKQLQEAQG